MKAQNELIRKHLEDGHAITSLMALHKFNSLRLAACVSELRGQGMNIKTNTIIHGSKRFASYELEV